MMIAVTSPIDPLTADNARFLANEYRRLERAGLGPDLRQDERHPELVVLWRCTSPTERRLRCARCDHRWLADVTVALRYPCPRCKAPASALAVVPDRPGDEQE